jgi:hypothetical protein
MLRALRVVSFKRRWLLSEVVSEMIGDWHHDTTV